ncbi:hypothetical protein ANAPRD1_00007 [Anaplasma phagocytophilum]|nr:hypothetical protein ANAPRD1_00007 [Anaplasma phagocytophilum]
MHQKNPIICALDTADLERATTLAKAISGKVAIQLHFRAISKTRQLRQRSLSHTSYSQEIWLVPGARPAAP